MDGQQTMHPERDPRAQPQGGAAMTLDDLVARLHAAHGDQLRAVVLYGSAATGEVRAARSDYNVLVLVESLGLGALRAVAGATRAWQEAGHPPPLTLTTREWRASADIFPMEYSDVLAHHRVLHGDFPREGIRVEPADLRRELEHQVLGKLLQLRTAVMRAGQDPARELALLEASLSTMMVLFRATARLHGEAPPSQREALAGWAGQAAGFDPAPFVRVVRHVSGVAPLPAGDAAAVLAGYLDALERLLTYVDAHVPRGPVA
jgi:hypothetical protein